MRHLIATVGLAGLLLAACGGSGAVAATVNGEEISETEVAGMLFNGDEDLSPDDFAAFLSLLIQWSATEQQAHSEFGITVVGDDVDAEIERALASSGFSDLDSLLESENVSEAGLRRFASQVMIEEQIREVLRAGVPTPTRDEAAETRDDQLFNLANVCVAHILVETEEEARVALDRVSTGEDFAEIAADVSLDTVSAVQGGSLECMTPSSLPTGFSEATMAADIGIVTGPVQSEFGYHLIVVENRLIPTIDEVLLAMHESAVTEAFDEWYLGTVVTAAITVNEEFGRWVTDPVPQVALTG